MSAVDVWAERTCEQALKELRDRIADERGELDELVGDHASVSIDVTEVIRDALEIYEGERAAAIASRGVRR